MKFLVLFFLAVLLASCSGYFNPDSALPAGDRMDALALADGSGYLSTDDHNEITPFIFKDTNTGKKILFFSSDRSGSYDIYYAEMYTNGKFARPVNMGASMNTTAGNEFSPALFYQQDITNIYHLYISFIRIIGQVTNLETYLLNADYSVHGFRSEITGDSFTHISIKRDGQAVYNYLHVADGTTNWSDYFWDYNGEVWITSSPVSLCYNDKSVFSVDNYMTGDTGEMSGSAFWYVFSAVKNGKFQIYAGGITNFQGMPVGQSFYNVGPYSSIYNDKDPYIDEDDTKLYFASDRYGKGNYDLYRQNVVRYDTIKAPFLDKPAAPTVTSVYPDPLQLNWTPVPGAAHYRVLSGMNGPYNFVPVADVTGTSFVDTGMMGGSYSYIIQAVNDWGYSESDFISGYYGMPVY
jgi:hypothetical protein